MSLAKYNRVVLDGTGAGVAATIEVRSELPGQPLAALYSDRDGLSGLGNPFTADSDGSFGFHVAGGAYQVRAYTGPSGSPTFERIWRYEAVGLGAESDNQGDILSTNNGSDFSNKKTTKDNLSVHGADVASASTIDLESATGDLIDVTGTTTITAITLGEGHERTVRFTGVLTLTHGASLVLPFAASRTTVAGDFAVFRGYAAGVVRCVEYQPFSARVAKDVISVHGSDIASASTINLETATGDVVDVTGTTTITAITLSDGHERTVRFTGVLTLTHSASLVLPGETNIITTAGDFARFRGYAGGVVRCVSYQLLKENEEVSTTVAFGSPFSLSTGGSGVVWNTVAIPRAGLWEISGNVGVVKIGAATPVFSHMHADYNASGQTTIQTAPGEGTTVAQHVTSNDPNGWILAYPTRRIRTTGAATLNCVVTADFTGGAGAAGAYGKVYARRVGY